MSRTLSIAEVAELYRCPVDMVENLVSAGQLPSVGTNGQRRIPLLELNRLLRQVDKYRIPGMLPVATPRRRRRR